MGFGLLDIPAVLSAPLPPAQPREVDDDVYWVKHASLTLSGRRRSATVTGSVAAHSDPADVYRVKLVKGDRLSVGAGVAKVRLSLWDPSTGAFDVTSNKLSHRFASGGRLSRVRIPRSGVYYLAVTPLPREVAGTTYTLKLVR
jgi:hypothetical protein